MGKRTASNGPQTCYRCVSRAGPIARTRPPARPLGPTRPLAAQQVRVLKLREMLEDEPRLYITFTDLLALVRERCGECRQHATQGSSARTAKSGTSCWHASLLMCLVQASHKWLVPVLLATSATRNLFMPVPCRYQLSSPSAHLNSLLPTRHRRTAERPTRTRTRGTCA